MDPVEQQPTGKDTPIAGFWRQAGALAIDFGILGIPAYILGFIFFQPIAALGQCGRLIGFVIALLYFGLLNSRVGGGQTISKRILDIRVTDRAGTDLSPARSIARFLVVAIPYFLNGLWLNVDATTAGSPVYFLGLLLSLVVFGGLGAAAWLFLFNRRTRQCLDDIVVGSFVVRGQPIPIPSGLSTPRVHLVVVGCWLALTLILPAAGIWAVRETGLADTFRPLARMQAALSKQPGVWKVKVLRGGTTMASASTGVNTTSFLQVDAQADRPGGDLDAMLASMAGAALDLRPDLFGSQLLIVQIQYKFDLGIASWTWTRAEAHDAAAWRERLKQIDGRTRGI